MMRFSKRDAANKKSLSWHMLYMVEWKGANAWKAIMEWDAKRTFYKLWMLCVPINSNANWLSQAPSKELTMHVPYIWSDTWKPIIVAKKVRTIFKCLWGLISVVKTHDLIDVFFKPFGSEALLFNKSNTCSSQIICIRALYLHLCSYSSSNRSVRMQIVRNKYWSDLENICLKRAVIKSPLW